MGLLEQLVLDRGHVDRPALGHRHPAGLGPAPPGAGWTRGAAAARAVGFVGMKGTSAGSVGAGAERTGVVRSPGRRLRGVTSRSGERVIPGASGSPAASMPPTPPGPSTAT